MKGIEAKTGATLHVADGATGSRVHYFAPSPAAFKAVERLLKDALGISIKVSMPCPAGRAFSLRLAHVGQGRKHRV